MTTLFISLYEDMVGVRYPSLGPIKVDTEYEVRPGQVFHGYSYEELRAMGEGMFEVPVREG